MRTLYCYVVLKRLIQLYIIIKKKKSLYLRGSYYTKTEVFFFPFRNHTLLILILRIVYYRPETHNSKSSNDIATAGVSH